ncbi:MAG: MFS transporter [Acidimicrobiia bacterium]
MTAPEIDDVQRLALQRRTLRVLTVGQIVGAASLGSALTVGAFVVQAMLGATTSWAGIATATTTTGTAFMSQVLSRRMARSGRRPGLQLGYALAVLGGIVCAVGAEREQLATFLVGLFLFGSGQASNLLARYAATDLARPEQRSEAMSRVVFASTFGAVFGPLVIGPIERAGQEWFGLAKYTGPWLFSAVFFALAAVNIAVRLRPDPLVMAGGVSNGNRRGGGATDARLGKALKTVTSTARGRLALAAMVISQVTMVGVMAMTPVHLKLHGHEGVSQFVVSTHIAGMYAFSPLVGRFSDRVGRLQAIVVGAATLVGATVLAALSGDVEQLLFPSLWALGIGWNFGLIGGSSLLVESVTDDERVGVQGAADLMMSFCGGMAGFASGFIRKAIGYHLLATVAMIAAGALLVAAYSAYKRSPHVPGSFGKTAWVR